MSTFEAPLRPWIGLGTGSFLLSAQPLLLKTGASLAGSLASHLYLALAQTGDCRSSDEASRCAPQYGGRRWAQKRRRKLAGQRPPPIEKFQITLRRGCDNQGATRPIDFIKQIGCEKKPGSTAEELLRQKFRGGEEKEEIEADDFIAILKYSPSPYREFRRSMAEMVEVRLGGGEKVDWDFLEELLFRYLDLNNEMTHRNVLRAFVDLVVVLHENDWRSPEQQRRPWEGVGGGGGRLLKGEK
ncbi:Transcription repressor OFP14 [Striga hermonthica]|uniref:Transcription repressor n=1 Tax=Striga hermonthica TaxID=68872 RepID=A0A9N7RC56_STRHE|nr:Transcription repressor OFP14 [Striga hermonthica]